MSRLTINTGTFPNDKSGDTLQTAFTKVNANFQELYTLTGGTSEALTELAQDYAVPLLVHNQHTNISFTYDDVNNKIIAVVADNDSAYVTLSNLTSTLTSYVTSSSLTTALNSYVTNTGLTSTLNSYVTNSHLTSTLSPYATQSFVTSQGYITNASVTPDSLVNGDFSVNLDSDGNLISSGPIVLGVDIETGNNLYIIYLNARTTLAEQFLAANYTGTGYPASEDSYQQLISLGSDVIIANGLFSAVPLAMSVKNAYLDWVNSQFTLSCNGNGLTIAAPDASNIHWQFKQDTGLRFPDGSCQTTAFSNPERLVNGNHIVSLDTSGNLNLTGGMINTAGLDFYWTAPCSNDANHWGSFNVNWGVSGFINSFQMNKNNILLSSSTLPIKLATNGNQWTFGSNGKLYLPSNGGITLPLGQSLNINTSWDDMTTSPPSLNRSSQWTFSPDGVLSGGSEGHPLVVRTTNGSNIYLTVNTKTWSFGDNDGIKLPNNASLQPTIDRTITIAQTALTSAITDWDTMVTQELGVYTLANAPGNATHFTTGSITNFTQAESWLTFIVNAWIKQTAIGTVIFDITPPIPRALYLSLYSHIDAIKRTYQVWELSPHSTDLLTGGSMYTFGSDGKMIFPDNTIQSTAFDPLSIETPDTPAYGPYFMVSEAWDEEHFGSSKYSYVWTTTPAGFIGYQDNELVGYSIRLNSNQRQVYNIHLSFKSGNSFTLVMVTGQLPNLTAGDYYIISDDRYVDVVVNPVNIVSNSHQWQFGTDGTLTAPGNISAASLTLSSTKIGLGYNSGRYNPGVSTVSIGDTAGNYFQGDYAIAIGFKAGANSQHANSIILNASSTQLDNTTSGLFIDPVRNDATPTNILYYNTTTKEISYGSGYSLPTATTSVLGGVKVDGTTITISNGIISGANTYVLPTATTSVLGGVKVDGTTITISNGIISGANTYVLPTATTSVLGGVKVDGSSITINNGTISSATYTLPTSTTSVLGGVKIDGSTITINNGTISSTNSSVTTESFTGLTGATGTVAHDCTSVKLFRHTSMAANFTANFTNLALSAGQATSITLILVQGATARMCIAVQIAGTAQTITWQGSASAPTGNNSYTDVVTFSIICTAANTYTVLGMMTSFGGA
jgi:hypothetical protein